MVEAHEKLGPVHEYDDIVGSFSPSDSSSSSSSGSSSESDSFEEVTSPSSASSSSSSSADQPVDDDDDALSDMSSLIQHLPIKRGLSRHYQGKSQSFTSLANVRSLEDLAKPENPYNKKLKYCSRSYGSGLGVGEGEEESKCANPSIVPATRHAPNKRGMHSRASCSSLSARRGSGNNSFIIGGNRPPIPPHRSTSTSTIPNQTALFA